MDYSRYYERISRPFRSERGTRAVNALDRALVFAFAAAYLVLLAVLASQGDGRVAKALVVPATTFALVTAARAAIDRPRPYESHDIDPIVRKAMRGKSMPSRHMASAVAIACALLWSSPAAGAVAAAGCACIAFTRLVGGVHYPSDIAVAVAVALACAGIGYTV